MAPLLPPPLIRPDSEDVVITSTSGAPPPPAADRPIKRQRTEEPLHAMPTRASAARASAARASVSRASVATTTLGGLPKPERDQFFDALESAAPFPGAPRAIHGPDDLDRAELLQCFELLHACGRATEPTATLAATRQSIDGFLEAIFKDWDSGAAEAPKPELDLAVSADVVSGRVCMVPEEHTQISDCLASEMCAAEVSAIATYSTSPPLLKLEYSTTDPFSGRGESICAVTRSDVRWVASDYLRTLCCSMQSKMAGKMHRHNKRLAVWHARRLVKGWAQGSICMGGEAARMGFLKADVVRTAIFGLGEAK